MPQNGLQIAVRTAERCLSEENPALAVEALIAPIPDDDMLKQRTLKANAQHALHNIAKELTINDVRRIFVGGNIGTLNLIAAALGIKSSLEVDVHFDEQGEWADERYTDRAEEIIASLTPEKCSKIKTVLSKIKNSLDSPEVKELLSQRKEFFQSWQDKSLQELSSSERQINKLANEIIAELNTVLFTAAQKFNDEESQYIIMYVGREIDKYMRLL